MSLLDIVIALLVFEAVLIIAAVAYIVNENSKRARREHQESQSKLFWESAE